MTCGWLLSLLLLLLGPACKKVDKMELDKGDIPLLISADRQSIILEEKNSSADAVNLSWTAGSNGGSNAALYYTLRLDKAGNQFGQAVSEDLGKAATGRKFTVKELNDLLLNNWQVAPGTEATLEARIIITIAGEPKAADSSPVFNFTVKSFEPVTTTLYLLGNAAPNGWSADNAAPMKPSLEGPGRFTWQGVLNPGDLKFITTLTQFLPSYNKGADDFHLVLRTADDQPDEKFRIETQALYDVAINLLDGTISITESSSPPYDRLWILGDAVPNGWDIQNPSEMRVDSSNLFVFTFNEILKAGEFKMPVATGDFGTDYWMPLTNNPALTETGVQLVPGGNPDYKWKITNPGPYKIRLDMQNSTIDIKAFTPYTQIWMVGDAAPAGWNIDNPTPMTPTANNPYEFSYTGPLKAGEFKFPLATGDWAVDFFMPAVNGSGPGSTQMKFIAKGSPDFKWKITEAGNYKVTINQLYETISIVKQ